MPAFISTKKRYRTLSLAVSLALGFSALPHTHICAAEDPVMQMIDDAGKAGVARDFKKAIDLYSRAIRSRPNDAALFALRGKVFTMSGDSEAAIKDFSRAISIDSENMANYYNRGMLYSGLERHDEAIGDFSIVLSANPDDHEALTHRAENFLQAKKYKACLQDTAAVLSRHPEYYLAMPAGATANYALQNYELAQEQLNTYLKLAPAKNKDKIAHAHFILAKCEEKTGDEEDAVKQYLKSIENVPSIEAHTSAATLLSGLGRDSEAVVQYTAAIKLNPKNERLYSQRGISYMQAGDNEKALKDLNTAIEMNPDSAEALANRGSYYKKTGEVVLSRVDVQKAWQLNPDLPVIYRLSALLNLELPMDGDGGVEKALQYAQKACELSNWEDPLNLDTLAAAYVASKDYVNAHKWLQESMKHNPPAILTSPGALQHQKEIAEKAAAAPAQ